MDQKASEVDQKASEDGTNLFDLHKIKKSLKDLNFDIQKENLDYLWKKVPSHHF